MRLALAAALLLAAAPAFAQAPAQPYRPPMMPPPSSELPAAIGKAYELGLQTGQDIAAALRAADERLKWVLDNWVPPQTGKAAPAP